MTQPGNEPPPDDHTSHELEEYAGGHVQAWMGHIPTWLLVVYAVMFVWALYYSYSFWGGVGPGRVE